LIITYCLLSCHPKGRKLFFFSIERIISAKVCMRIEAESIWRRSEEVLYKINFRGWELLKI